MDGPWVARIALASLSEELEDDLQTGMLAGAGELVGRVERVGTRRGCPRSLGGERLTWPMLSRQMCLSWTTTRSTACYLRAASNKKDIGPQWPRTADSRVEQLHVDSFDVVLLDVLMPGVDGFEVLAHMQADGELRRIPVIMISALEDIENVVRGIRSRSLGLSTKKPFDAALLRARINGCLAKKQLDDLERKRVRDVFSRFVPEHVVDEVLTRTDDDLRLSGVTLDGTVIYQFSGCPRLYGLC